MRPRSLCKVRPNNAETTGDLSGLRAFENHERWLATHTAFCRSLERARTREIEACNDGK